MTLLCGVEENRFLRPGTLVRLAVKVNNCDMLEPDCGVVIRCWRDSNSEVFECLVAFVGEDFRVRPLTADPYLSIFAATSLAEVDPENETWPV